MKNFFSFGLAFVFFSSAVFADGDTLRVGTTVDFRPFSYYDFEKNKFDGFDIELIREFAKTERKKVILVPSKWEKIIKELEYGVFDMAIGGVTFTRQRAKKVAFANSFYYYSQTFLVRDNDKNTYKNLKDLDKPNVRIGYTKNGSNDKFAKRVFRHAKLVAFEKIMDMPSALMTGKVTAMVTDEPNADVYAHRHEEIAAPFENKIFTNDAYGYAFKKSDRALRYRFNKFIRKAKKSGMYQRLKRKYLKK